MNNQSVLSILKERFEEQNISELANGLIKATDNYDDQPYAVYYFDTHDDNLNQKAAKLDSYLDEYIAEDYFNSDNPVDLRWNTYLYFVVDATKARSPEFYEQKSLIESNYEYAKKLVIPASRLKTTLRRTTSHLKREEPDLDIKSRWLSRLNDDDLGYLLDTKITIPTIVKRVARGDKKKLEAFAQIQGLSKEDQAASNSHLKKLTIKGFRKFPEDKTYNFGKKVNLITGPNGYGKTSLLESIEYLFCGQTLRDTKIKEKTKDKIIKPTVLSAELFNSDVLLKMTAAPSAKKLKERNLGWYGQRDIRGSTLESSFSRFNFLDTDSAIRLAYEDSKNDLSKDIASIALGADANVISDHLRRVSEALDSNINTTSNTLTSRRQNLPSLRKQLKYIESQKTSSDNISNLLLKSLETICWKAPPPSKMTYDGAEELLINLAEIKEKALPIGNRTLSQIKSDIAKSKADFANAVKAEKRLNLIQSELEGIHPELSALESQMRATKELESFPLTLERLEQQRRDSSRELSRLLSDLPKTSSVETIDEELKLLKLSEAKNIVNEKVNNSREHKDRIRNTLAKIERSLSTLSSNRERLISLGKSIIEQTGDDSHCPLCQSKFAQGELLVQIGTSLQTSFPESYSELQSEFSALENSSRHLQSINELLLGFSNYFRHSSELTVQEAIDEIESQNFKVRKLREDLEATESRLHRFNNAGFTLDKLHVLMSDASLSELSKGSLESRQSEIESEMERLNQRAKRLQNEEESVKQAISPIFSQYKRTRGLNDYYVSDVIENHIYDLESYLLNCNGIGQYIKLKDDQPLSTIARGAANSIDLASSLISTFEKEKDKSARIDELKSEIAAAEAMLSRLEEELERLQDASNLARDLLYGKDSLENIRKSLLATNSAVISDIFSKIHQPNEYRLDVSDGLIKLVSKANEKEIRSLAEVSTGQRAAVTLSIFLAMNKISDKAPSLILLDDPISHVDDINMLSFLDYLRDLVVDDNKQIFFATPSKKLAGLFKHKFNFLGQSDFKNITLHRSF